MGALTHKVLAMLPSAVAGRLRAWRVRTLISGFEPYIVEHAYGPARFKVYVADPLARGWYDHDWTDLPEIAALRGTSLRPGALVFDIGAHQGVVAMMLAQEVGPAGVVIALEPNPHNAAAARRNCELNVMAQLVVVEAAVSNHSGTVTFNESLDGQLDDGSGAHGRITVESVTLDDLAEKYGMPALVFIDVEGAECMVLENGARVLESGADFAVEVHVGFGLEKLGGSVDRLLSFFPAEWFAVTARAEHDTSYRPLTTNDSLTNDRFFLLAVSKRRMER
jgi:FkbM family methyltransferase